MYYKDMDYKVLLSKQVDDQLEYLIHIGEQELAQDIAFFLKNVQQYWPYKQSNIKNIGNNIYRKRLQRWRLLYTIDIPTITFWILDIEKDTKKDYKKRKSAIKKQQQ